MFGKYRKEYKKLFFVNFIINKFIIVNFFDMFFFFWNICFVFYVIEKGIF